MNNEKLKKIISVFIQNQEEYPDKYKEGAIERKERKAHYQSFSKDKLLKMTEDDFYEYIGEALVHGDVGRQKLYN